MALSPYPQQSMAWQIYNTPKNLVYQANLDFTTYSSYSFKTSGSVSGSVLPDAQNAQGVGVDNSTNNNYCSVSVGGKFVENIPPYTKTVVSLGDGSQINISSSGGQVVVTFYTGVYPGSIAQTNILGATKAAIAVYLPPGTGPIPWAGLVGTIPDGWLYCNGQAISRITYAALFAAVGTKYGAGDGTTTFNLPDMRGAFQRGFDDGRGLDTGRVLGSYQGFMTQNHYHRTASSILNQVAFFAKMSGGPFYGWDYMQLDGAYTAALTETAPTGYYPMARTDTVVYGANDASETRPDNVSFVYRIKT